MTRILILCTGNSCRSQMAEGIVRTLDPLVEAHSAGTHPATRVHPMAVRVMKEIGVNIASAAPKSVDRYTGEAFDAVFTVCDHARETCPVFTGTVGLRLHQSFDDPALFSGTEEEVLQEFRRVRDQIRWFFTGVMSVLGGR